MILTTNVHYLLVDIADNMFRGLHVDVIHYKGYPAHYHDTCSGTNKGNQYVTLCFFLNFKFIKSTIK